MNIENAKITNAKICEDHGCLTVYIILEGDGWSCGFGGYCLDHWFNKPGEYLSSDGYGALIELMKTFEVWSWEDLIGQYCRVKTEGYGGNIVKIGHLLKDKWFSWKEYFEEVHKVNEVQPDED